MLNEKNVYVVSNGDFSKFETKGYKLIKEDRNGTRTYIIGGSDRCPKCNGQGYIQHYHYVENGRCFLCGGSGRYITPGSVITVRTKEYHEKLEKRREKIARKNAPSKNKQFYEKNFLGPEGQCFLVMGNTYNIKEQLKEEGAHYKPDLGWYFGEDHEAYKTIEISEKILSYSFTGLVDFVDDCDEVVKKIKEQYEIENRKNDFSSFFGAVKDKVTCSVSYKYSTRFFTDFTRYGEVSYLYVFEDTEGHTFCWKTQKELNLEKDKKYCLKGTVKDHKEYKGVKQTYLTRCKIEEI